MFIDKMPHKTALYAVYEPTGNGRGYDAVSGLTTNKEAATKWLYPNHDVLVKVTTTYEIVVDTREKT